MVLTFGFPGTPAELRPLGESLYQAGWTAEGLPLPGFGADIETLFERQASAWVIAVGEALINLQRQHNPVVQKAVLAFAQNSLTDVEVTL